MIDLSLARIGRLLQYAPPPRWKAIHVAGTNGKGSVCAYLSAMLHVRGIPCARFTSPHFIDRWDGIVVDEHVVGESAFRAAEQTVLRRDREHRIGATEFELLTATAFELFDDLGTGSGPEPSAFAASAPAAAAAAPPALSAGYGGPPLAVIETGLGGSLDATTAMRATRAVTVVTRIGLDHQNILGHSVAAIAAHKAGIMQPGVPCVVDPANRDDASVRAIFEARARDVGASLVYPAPFEPRDDMPEELRSLEPHQLANLACAYAAFRIAVNEGGVEESDRLKQEESIFLASVIKQLRWPGRLQRIDVGPLLRQGEHGDHLVSRIALLDGAHNPQSAEVLGAYVANHLRTNSDIPKRITWVLAASHGKNLDAILPYLLRPGDRVAAVKFSAVDGMPWVQPAAPQAILEGATALGVVPADQFSISDSQHASQDPTGLQSALCWATTKAAGGGDSNNESDSPLVIGGSLYLVSDVLRLLRQAGGETGLP